MMTIQDKLNHAVTEWDRKQSTRRGYNRYALAQYLAAVDRVCESIKHEGVTIQMALHENFEDRLLDVCLKAVQ